MADEAFIPEKKKKKKTSKYLYSYGDEYPSSKAKVPFKDSGLQVPTNMGWLWTATNVPGMKPRKGWAPGAIGKSVAKLMSFKCPRGNVDRSKKKKKKKSKHGGLDTAAQGDSEEDEWTPKPTLRINRKANVFTIEVQPLKDLNEIGPNEDPYVDCEPLVFKIEKSRTPEELARMEARKMFKVKKQRDAEIRKALAEAVEDICKCVYMDVYCNDLTAIDKVINNCPNFQEPECICEEESMSSLSSQATWDIEYTPPFGCFDLAPRKRRDFVHVETQYDTTDFGVPAPSCCCVKTNTTEKAADTKKKCTGKCKKS